MDKEAERKLGIAMRQSIVASERLHAVDTILRHVARLIEVCEEPGGVTFLDGLNCATRLACQLRRDGRNDGEIAEQLAAKAFSRTDLNDIDPDIVGFLLVGLHHELRALAVTGSRARQLCVSGMIASIVSDGHDRPPYLQ